MVCLSGLVMSRKSFLIVLFLSLNLVFKLEAEASSASPDNVISVVNSKPNTESQNVGKAEIQFPKTRAFLLKESNRKIQQELDAFKAKTGLDINKILEGDRFKADLEFLSTKEELSNIDKQDATQYMDESLKEIIYESFAKEGIDTSRLNIKIDSKMPSWSLACCSFLSGGKFLILSKDFSKNKNFFKASLHHEISHLRHNDSYFSLALYILKFYYPTFKKELDDLEKRLQWIIEYRADMEAATFSLDNANNKIKQSKNSFEEMVKYILNSPNIYLPNKDEIRKLLDTNKDYENYPTIANLIESCFKHTHPSCHDRIKAIEDIIKMCEAEAKQ